MWIKRCFISFSLLLVTIPWPAFAQQEACREIPATAINGLRRVLECSRSSSEGGAGMASIALPPPEMETREFYIPDFQAGDGVRHVYVLTFFSDTGVGNTNLYPDEYGVARAELPRPLLGDGEEEPAMIISSADVETGELRFSLDVSGVLAYSLVNALFNAKMNLEGDLARLRSEPRRRPFEDGRPPRNDLVLGQRRVTLAGENLSLDETLDLLYQVSGCSVFQEGNYLAAKSCR